MIVILVFILIIFPLFFQIIFGRKAIGEDIKLKFGEVCLISFLGQILLSVIAFFLMGYMLQKNGNQCGTPLAAIIILSQFFTFVLIVTIIIQYFIKKSYDTK
jgi:hypothetical protein